MALGDPPRSRLRTRPVRRALARALVGFASEIGATIMAEGIETGGELETLRHLGVPSGQGFYLAHPGPPVSVAGQIASAGSRAAE